MKWAEITVQTSHEATEAVANIFHELGASGVVIEDPELINSYRRSGTWEYCDIPEEEDTQTVTVTAYLPVNEELNQKLHIFEQRINDLTTHNLDKGSGKIQLREIAEEDWSSSWKQFFHPLKIGERVVIKPSWENYQQLNDEVVVELDPGMAFGTGNHHTTSMCIGILEDVIQTGHVVFDIGTGSGILAIVCAKLGASSVQAVDIDSVAVQVAADNILKNKVEDIVSIKRGDLLSGVTGKADVIIANIIADVIVELITDVSNKLNEHGLLIASGIISDRLTDVSTVIMDHGLTIEKVIEQGGWVAMVVSKGGE